MSQSITLREVARVAGVHHTTVSRALRGQRSIPASTREKIRAVAEQLGYCPNPLISTWMSHRRATSQHSGAVIGFIVRMRNRQHWEEAPSFTRYFAGAEARAKALGFGFEEFWLGEPRMTQKRLDRILLARRVDGLIIGSSTLPRSSLRLSWENFAAVAQGFSLSQPRLSLTANNYAHTMETLIRELRHLGYRRIGYFISPVIDARWSPFGPGAFLVYQQQLAARDRVPLFRGDMRQKAAFQKWVAEHRPEVIITCDVIVERWLAQMGRQVPGDVGVAYADWNQADTGHAAGVDHQLEEAGAAAVDLIAARLQTNERGIPEVPRAILIPGRWVPGKTVRKVGPPAPLRRRSAQLGLMHL